MQLNNEVKILHKNKSTFIPLEAKHRLSNYEDKPFLIIELQSGDNWGEDDIFWGEDIFGILSSSIKSLVYLIIQSW